MIAWWLLLACPKSTVIPESRVEAPSAVVKGVESFEPLETGAIWEGSGLSLRIPEGWTARQGPREGSLLLRMEHPKTGVQFEIWSFAPSGTPGPRPRNGCAPLFRDRSDYRSIPVLTSVTTATCVGNEADGVTVQGWYALNQGREVHLEAIYRSGTLFSGQALVSELLSGLRRASATKREAER